MSEQADEKLDIVSLKEILLNIPGGPRSDLDDIANEEIGKWSVPPKAIEVLHTLDICCYGSLTSDFIMRIMGLMLQETIKNEKTTYEEVVKQAHWREPVKEVVTEPELFLPKMTVEEYVYFMLTGDKNEVTQSIVKLCMEHSLDMSMFGAGMHPENAQLTIGEINELMGCEESILFELTYIMSLMLGTISYKDKLENRTKLFDWGLVLLTQSDDVCDVSIRWYEGLR